MKIVGHYIIDYPNGYLAIYNRESKECKLFTSAGEIRQAQSYVDKTINESADYLCHFFEPRFAKFGQIIGEDNSCYVKKYMDCTDEELEADGGEDFQNFLKFEAKFFNFFAEFRLGDAPNGYGNTFRRRELNTFLCTPLKERKEYVASYYQLFDYENKDSVLSKLESEEFNVLCQEAEKWEVEAINKRLTILWGGYGEGKTTFIQNHPKWSKYRFDTLDNSLGAQEVKCSFYFEDGKPIYLPSELMKAIINGEDGIVLDELGHARLDYLEGIQAITDNKNEIIFEGTKYTIKDDFEVICTMNLYEADGIHKIPQGLLSRAKQLKYFIASDEDIARQMKPRAKKGV